MSPLLELIGLQVGFPGQVVVRGIDLTIAPGECVALVGESGCGKSATAFAILRLLPPGGKILGGQVIFDGVDLATLAPRELRAIRGKAISLILQEPMTSLNPVLPIGLQISEVIRRHETLSQAAVKARVLELLDLVGIADGRRRVQNYPHEFSGGMRQRVMIAMAVACHPRLLIADEPTTALDVTIQAQVMELLDRLRRQLSMAMLLITHDLGAVAQWADRVAVMYAGRIVEAAATKSFFGGPVHPYSQGLLGASVSDTLHYTTDRLTEIPGSVASAAGEMGCAFAPRCPVVIRACRVAPPALQRVGEGWAAACVRVAA